MPALGPTRSRGSRTVRAHDYRSYREAKGFSRRWQRRESLHPVRILPQIEDSDQYLQPDLSKTVSRHCGLRHWLRNKLQLARTSMTGINMAASIRGYRERGY
jgi:hypothetical protein